MQYIRSYSTFTIMTEENNDTKINNRLIIKIKYFCTKNDSTLKLKHLINIIQW
ncbi:MAG: hypothetical protein IJU54_00785 [Alphaproteobacteria bacterium]|nr:hypothetical protein [Alphaproteobacteria bacterium]